MSPFDIPELAEQIAIHLTAHDLTQCARVNKAWNSLVTPFVWYTVPPHTMCTRPQPWETKDMWGDLCLKDMFYELLVLEEENNEEDEEEDLSSASHIHKEQQQQPIQSGGGSRGSWHLIKDLDIHQFSFAERSTSQHSYGRLEPKPTIPHHINEKLMLHFLELCTGVQSLRVAGQCWTQTDVEFWRQVLSLFSGNSNASNNNDNTSNVNCKARKAPLKELVITLFSSFSFEKSPVAPLVFSHCPRGLQKLTLHISCKDDNEQLFLDRAEKKGGGKTRDADSDSQADEIHSANVASAPETMHQPRESHYPMYRAELGSCPGIMYSAQEAESVACHRVSTSSPRWCSQERPTQLGRDQIQGVRVGFLDKELALMLLAGRAGWRVVDVPVLGTLSAEALIERHCPTLESLYVVHATEYTSPQLAQILSSSPRLHTFVTLDAGHIILTDSPFITAKDLIDMDPSTGSLKPWQCEATLKDFRAKITGIPRPDLSHTFHHNPLRKGMVLQESFPGESAKLQRQVYERLARLNGLERLSLGFEERDGQSWFRLCRVMDSIWEEDERHQYGCLAMSLASGLGALEGLKELRELNITRMATAVGVEEVQWMVQN
ncbi:hypothetical protein BGW39_001618 [Mortierella sp. 14UC]|nr:hypothetical protein BGW39_001618 [Mortierella sp. 14UC]